MMMRGETGEWMVVWQLKSPSLVRMEFQLERQAWFSLAEKHRGLSVQNVLKRAENWRPL